MPQRVLACFVACLAVFGTATAQSRPPALGDVRLEAATIKPSKGSSQSPRAPDLFSRNYISLRALMIYAYDLPMFRIVGGPAWVDDARFDVLAKASATPKPEEMRRLIQRLLEERFALTLRRETRELPTYDLVQARSDGRPGAGLKPAAVDCEPFLTGQRPMSESPRIQREPGEMARCAAGLQMGSGVVRPWLNGVRLARLADFLSRTVNRVVVDKTGLDGAYDIDLQFVDENLPPELRGPNAPEGPVLQTALPEQLGLRLSSTRGSVEVLVIDAASRPPEN
jgi:uncharacterized protein (TIGR03435 family)